MVTLQLAEHTVNLFDGMKLVLFSQLICDNVAQGGKYVQVAILLGSIHIHLCFGYAFLVCFRIGDFQLRFIALYA